MKILVKTFACLLLLLSMTGCANYERAWRHARVQSPAKPGAVTGAWEGTWLSDVNGHTGRLRCLVTQKNQQEYEFHFKATYWKLFRYSYLVTLPVTHNSAGYTFSGDEDLGYLAGGIYHYDGTITGTNLNATYSCKFDHGTFTLSRP